MFGDDGSETNFDKLFESGGVFGFIELEGGKLCKPVELVFQVLNFVGSGHNFDSFD